MRIALFLLLFVATSTFSFSQSIKVTNSTLAHSGFSAATDAYFEGDEMWGKDPIYYSPSLKVSDNGDIDFASFAGLGDISIVNRQDFYRWDFANNKIKQLSNYPFFSEMDYREFVQFSNATFFIRDEVENLSFNNYKSAIFVEINNKVERIAGNFFAGYNEFKSLNVKETALGFEMLVLARKERNQETFTLLHGSFTIVNEQLQLQSVMELPVGAVLMSTAFLPNNQFLFVSKQSGVNCLFRRSLVDGSLTTQLAENISGFAVSKNGQIAYVVNGSLFIQNSSEQLAVKVADNVANGYGDTLGWSDSGTRLVFISKNEILEYNFVSNKINKLINANSSIKHPVISSNGKYLAYVQLDGSFYQVMCHQLSDEQAEVGLVVEEPRIVVKDSANNVIEYNIDSSYIPIINSVTNKAIFRIKRLSGIGFNFVLYDLKFGFRNPQVVFSNDVTEIDKILFSSVSDSIFFANTEAIKEFSLDTLPIRGDGKVITTEVNYADFSVSTSADVFAFVNMSDKIKIIDANANDFVSDVVGRFPVVTPAGNRVYYLVESGDNYIIKALSKINGLWQKDDSVSIATNIYNRHDASVNGRFIFFENGGKFCHDIYKQVLAASLKDTFLASNDSNGVHVHFEGKNIKFISAKNSDLLDQYELPIASKNINAVLSNDASSSVLTFDTSVALVNRVVYKSLPKGFINVPAGIEDHKLELKLEVLDELDGDLEFLGLGSKTQNGTLVVNQNFELTYTPNENFNTQFGPSESFSVKVRDSFGQVAELNLGLNISAVADDPELSYNGVIGGSVAMPPNSGIEIGVNNKPYEDPDKLFSISAIEPLVPGDEIFVEFNAQSNSLVPKASDFKVLGYEDLLLKYEVAGKEITETLRIEHSYEVELFAGWNAIGVPFDFSERSLNDINNDHLGMFKWDVLSEFYVDIPENYKFHQGEAIWLFKDVPSTALISPNVKAPAKNALHDEEFFKVELVSNAWNFFSPIGYGSEARILESNSSTLWQWNPLFFSYSRTAGGVMTPMQGYWNFGKKDFINDANGKTEIRFENR